MVWRTLLTCVVLSFMLFVYHTSVTPERVSKQKRMLTRVKLLRKYSQVDVGVD